MLLQIIGVHSFYGIIVFRCASICHVFFIYLSTARHPGRGHILVAVNGASVTRECEYLFGV
jgi:hypothetical protein